MFEYMWCEQFLYPVYPLKDSESSCYATGTWNMLVYTYFFFPMISWPSLNVPFLDPSLEETTALGKGNAIACVTSAPATKTCQPSVRCSAVNLIQFPTRMNSTTGFLFITQVWSYNFFLISCIKSQSYMPVRNLYESLNCKFSNELERKIWCAPVCQCAFCVNTSGSSLLVGVFLELCW